MLEHVVSRSGLQKNEWSKIRFPSLPGSSSSPRAAGLCVPCDAVCPHRPHTPLIATALTSSLSVKCGFWEQPFASHALWGPQRHLPVPLPTSLLQAGVCHQEMGSVTVPVSLEGAGIPCAAL